jgi:hypothetical protein
MAGIAVRSAMGRLHDIFAVIPFRLRNAGADRCVIFSGGGQIQVELDARLGRFAIASQRQFIEVTRRIAGIRVFVVVVGAIDPDVFGPGWQALGAEHGQHRILVVRCLDLLGLVRFLGQVAAASRRKFSFGSASLTPLSIVSAISHSSTGCGGVDFGVERRQGSDRTRLLQGLANGMFLGRFVRLQGAGSMRPARCAATSRR